VKREITVPASLVVALDVSPVHPLPFGETNPDPEDAKRSVTLDQPGTPGSVSPGQGHRRQGHQRHPGRWSTPTAPRG